MMIYVIYGSERMLMDQQLTKLKKQYHCDEDKMNFSCYDVSETGMEAVYEDIVTPSFFSDHKMVVIKKADFLTTKKMKKDNNDVDIFERCLKNSDDHAHLVIFNDEKNFDERKKIVKQLRKQAKFYDIGPLNYYKVSDTTRQAIKKRGATIDDDALELLLSRKGTNLLDVSHEVEKLCLYTKHIDLKSVDTLVAKPLDENVFDLTTAILNKDRRLMFQVYHDLMILNEEPIKLIVLIANSMRLIYQVKLLDRKGYTDQEIAKILKVNPYRLKYIRNEGKDYDLDELLSCLNELSILDIKIKTGKIDKQKGLELFMLRI